MPPKPAKIKKPDFLYSCKSGDTETIQELFNQTPPNVYAEGLKLFLDFLDKNPPEA